MTTLSLTFTRTLDLPTPLLVAERNVLPGLRFKRHCGTRWAKSSVRRFSSHSWKFASKMIHGIQDDLEILISIPGSPVRTCEMRSFISTKGAALLLISQWTNSKLFPGLSSKSDAKSPPLAMPILGSSRPVLIPPMTVTSVLVGTGRCLRLLCLGPETLNRGSLQASQA